MVNCTYIPTEDMIYKLQSLKDKIKLKYNQNLSNYYEEVNYRRQSGTFRFEEDPFGNKVEGIGENYQELLTIMNILQTKPQVKNMNFEYNDLFYTVKENRDQIVLEEIYNYDKLCDNIRMPSFDIGIKPREQF